jgi:hypothetical protein
LYHSFCTEQERKLKARIPTRTGEDFIGSGVFVMEFNVLPNLFNYSIVGISILKVNKKEIRRVIQGLEIKVKHKKPD